MEPRLALLAALIASVPARIAAAEPGHKDLARSLFDLGVDEYKAKDYAAAAASMGKSYALDPQPNALYALAQAERLSSNCKSAEVHYQQLLETTKDEQTSQAVKANIELCKQIDRGEQAKAAPVDDKIAAQRDAPTIQYRTIYRTERTTDVLAIGTVVVGGVALGGAVTSYLLARSTESEEAGAKSLDQYNSLYDRARKLRLTAYIAGGAGALLVGFATVRFLRGGKARSREVAILPLRGGSMLAFSSTW